MNKYLVDLLRSTLAGICISIGGAVYLKLGGIPGAVLFAFGLLSVIHFKLPLFTGTVGFVNGQKEWLRAYLIVLLGNVIGCIFSAVLLPGDINGNSVINGRIETGYWNCFVGAIFCGIIMTLAVKAGRDRNPLLILYGIPLFILSGFYHSIADAFYASTIIYSEKLLSFIPYWILIVLGNTVGCNIPRLLKYE